MKSKNYCKPHPSCRIFALHLRCITLANGSEPVTLLLRFGYALVTLKEQKSRGEKQETSERMAKERRKQKS